jgi:hypothetical protein
MDAGGVGGTSRVCAAPPALERAGGVNPGLKYARASCAGLR